MLDPLEMHHSASDSLQGLIDWRLTQENVIIKVVIPS